MTKGKYLRINANFKGNKTFGNESSVTLHFDLTEGTGKGFTLQEWIDNCEEFLKYNVKDSDMWDLIYIVGMELVK